MSTVKSGRRAATCRTEERNSCAHKIRRSGNLQPGLFANKISSRVKRSHLAGVGVSAGLFEGENPTRYDGNMTRRYSEQVPGACLEFGVSTTLKSWVCHPFPPAPVTSADITPSRSFCRSRPLLRSRTAVYLSFSLSLSFVRTPLH